MPVRSKNELKQIFIDVHNSIVDENFELCDKITTALVNNIESEFVILYKDLSKKCLDKLKEYNITPEEMIIIKANLTKWTVLCVPYILKAMERRKDHE